MSATETEFAVAYLLWQSDQGYINAEDRAVGSNWMLGDSAMMHPEDAANLPGWLDAAREVIALVSTQIEEAKEV